MTNINEKIQHLKKEKDAVILAHYYVPEEVQAVADYIGDSYYLSKLATEVPQKTICFAGVNFMGESAKLLNPDKTVIMADLEADCPMAHMATPEKVAEVRAKYPDVAVVCYINSTAKLKECADVCVTSSNAMKIVRGLPNKTIYFIPDEHLGRYIAGQVPEKEFIFNDGYCLVHTKITAECVRKAKEQHKGAKVLAHPECTMDVLDLADYIGSTSGIIAYAGSDPCEEFIICTESGVFYELRKQNPKKQFYPANDCQICHNMKKVTLEKIAACLVSMEPRVEIGREQSQIANVPLIRMLEMAK